MPRKADHTRIHSLQKRWRKKQIHQVSENVEKRTEEKKIKDNEINGRKKKFHNKKNGVCQILHSHETQHSSQLDLLDLDLKIRVSQRPEMW